MRSSPGARALVLAVLAALARVSAEAAEAEVVERVVASVDGRPVLLSETRAVEAARGLAGSAAVDALIDERLMYREATRLPAAVASPAEEERALATLRSERPEAFERVKVADLRALLRRQIVILRYIELRFLPQVRIADETVREAYDAELGGRPDAPSFADAAAEIKERLVRRDLDARIEAWVRELRAGAEVRYNP
jgi:hypothetical protein